MRKIFNAVSFHLLRLYRHIYNNDSYSLNITILLIVANVQGA